MTATMLSENEMIIMNLLWKEDRPLSRSEILKGTPGRNWNPASVHLILNSMISKGAIKITDESVTYNRTYESVLTYDEYVLNLLKVNIFWKSEKEILKDCIRILKKVNKG